MQILNSNTRVTNKQNVNSSPSKQLQKIKIQLNDCIFQYHKLQQDYAQEKAKLFIQFQKERAFLSKTIKQLRDKNNNDNLQWTKKIDQLRMESQAALNSLTNSYQQKNQSQKEALKNEIQVNFKTEINQLKINILTKTQEYQSKLRYQKKEKQLLIQSLNSNFKKKQDQKDKAYHVLIQGLKKQNDQQITNLRLLYMKEQQNRRKLQRQIEEIIKEHIKQKIILQASNSGLIDEQQKLLTQISKLKQSIQTQKQNRRLVSCIHQEKLKLAETQYKDQINRIKAEYQIKSKRTFQIYNQQITKLKIEINSLQKIHKQKEKIWDGRGKKLLQMYQKRQSKREDVKAIESLQVELIKRDFMLQRERKQLKHCKLQLQNMEQIYDKMFISNNYLSRLKSKSFKIKKLKTSTMLNSSNRSTILQDKKYTLEDK